MDRIPVYVMTGFLGSGKSHRLNDILAQRRYRKCLVILSEKGRTDVSTEDKIVLDASSLSDEELVEKAGRIIRDHWIGEIWWEWNGMRPFSDWEHLVYETHLSRLMEPKRVFFSADENFVNFFLGKTGTAILTQLESADEILFFTDNEKGKGVKEAGKKLSAWNPSASFRIVTPKSSGNLYVRSGRFTDHFKGLWQRRLDIFILLWSFLFLAAALLAREENLLRISLLAVGITLQTLPFVLIGVLLSTGMQMYSSRPPWEIYLRKHPVLSVPLALIGGFFFPFCDCALTPLFRGLLQKGRASSDYHDIPHGRPADESGRPRQHMVCVRRRPFNGGRKASSWMAERCPRRCFLCFLQEESAEAFLRTAGGGRADSFRERFEGIALPSPQPV